MLRSVKLQFQLSPILRSGGVHFSRSDIQIIFVMHCGRSGIFHIGKLDHLQFAASASYLVYNKILPEGGQPNWRRDPREWIQRPNR